MPEVDDEDALYGLDPREFVAARNALARRLRAEGEKERAAVVATLRRPPKSAWALNVLAREHPASVGGFLDAATALAGAFGAGGDELRDAQAAYRRALESTVDGAVAASGVDGDAQRERMRSTLSAAANDDAVAAQLRAGVLRDDHEAPGFALGAGWAAGLAEAEPRRRPPAAPSRKAAPPPTSGRATGTEDRTRAAREAEEAAEARRAAIRERRQLERRVDTLRRRVERLQRTATEAEERAAAARRETEDAAGELAELEQRLRSLGGGEAS